MKNKAFLGALGIFAVFAVGFLFLKQNAPSTPVNNTSTSVAAAPQARMVPYTEQELIKPHSPVKGAFSAKVTMVEFLDPECEACAATYPMVKKIIAEFDADLKIAVRYMPYHQNSKYVANILEGARAQGKYWEALELLFATQNQWANHHAPKPELIPELLKPLKLKMEPILADAKAGKYDAQIMQDMDDGKAVGVRGTPTFFVNGVMVEELSYEALRSAIQSHLQK